jgi:hypothetical protein
MARWTLAVTTVVAAGALAVTGSAAAAADDNASCVGIAPSGAAGVPGVTANAVQTFRELEGQLGPFLSEKAKLHPGSFEGCGFPLPPPS